MMWTSNPVADAAMHDRELEEALEDYPVCDRCGEQIYPGENVYDIDGELWCEHCMDNARSTIETWMDARRGI